MASDSTPQKIRVPQPWKDFLAGYISGVANICVGQPFDICKVRIQSRGQGSFLSTFSSIIKNEGPLALWKGSTFPLITFGVCNAILFAANEKAKYFFRSTLNKKELNFGYYFLAGGFAGLANTVVSCPMEHIRIRMQIQDANFKLYNNSIDAAKKIFREFGLRGVYKGLWVSLAKEFFLYAGYFAAYEWIRQQNPSMHPLWLMFCGGVAGMGGWSSCFLLDNVKSKIQSDSFTDPKYKNARTLLRTLSYKEMSKGFSVGLIRSFPVNLVTFFTFELASMGLYGDKY